MAGGDDCQRVEVGSTTGAYYTIIRLKNPVGIENVELKIEKFRRGVLTQKTLKAQGAFSSRKALKRHGNSEIRSKEWILDKVYCGWISWQKVKIAVFLFSYQVIGGYNWQKFVKECCLGLAGNHRQEGDFIPKKWFWVWSFM